MYTCSLIESSLITAVGGPEKPIPAEQVTPTVAGRFVVASIGPHTSASRWIFSAVPWGTPIRLNAKQFIEVQYRGKWVLISELPIWSKYFAGKPAEATTYFMKVYKDLMAGTVAADFGLTNQSQLPAPWNTTLPPYWNLNDFGRVAVKYFVDTNGNRRLDKGEELLADFVHTTPNEEMETILSKSLQPLGPMTLGSSHGCIHMIPGVLQNWIAKGYVAVGSTLEVHPYSEKVIARKLERRAGRTGVEMHFYPNAGPIKDTGYAALYRVTKK